MAAKQGFLMYYSKGDAIGTKVSVRYRRSGRLSGVVVKRGSTVYYIYNYASQLHRKMKSTKVQTLGGIWRKYQNILIENTFACNLLEHTSMTNKL